MAEFHSSHHLSTPKAPTSSAVQASFSNIGLVNEARWWDKHFSLGSSKKYFSSSSVGVLTPHSTIVSNVVFDPSTNLPGESSNSQKNHFAVASGPRVLLYGQGASISIERSFVKNSGSSSVSSIQADRQISSQQGPAYCLSYRNDGRLLLIGGAEGSFRVCDTGTRAILKSFTIPKLKSNNVRAVAWLGLRKVASAGDDGAIRIWDFGSDKPLLTLSKHGDSVRTMLFNERNNTLISGSYDHSIRLWDLSENADKDYIRELAVLDHGAPVEALITLPGPVGLVASAGGRYIKVWDVSTGKVLYKVSSHSKTITSLCIVGDAGPNSNNSSKNKQYRLLSGGLDGFIKVYDLNPLKCIHTSKVGSPVTSIAVSLDNMRLVVGHSDGKFSVRQRKYERIKKKKATPMGGTLKHAMRSSLVDNPTAQDFATEPQQKKRRKLHNFDKSLKSFRYVEALDQALDTKRPESVAAVLEALIARGGLTRALSNRDELELEPIVSFTLRYIARPNYTEMLIFVCNELCDIYGPVANQSSLLSDQFQKLRIVVENQIRVQREIMELQGMLELVHSVATLHS